MMAAIVIFSVITGIVLYNKEKLFPASIRLPEVSKEAKDSFVIDIIEEKEPESKDQQLEATEDQSKVNWQWVNNQKKLYELTPTQINSILKELQNRFPNRTERLKALAILRLGTPYQFGGLGEEAGRDKDPIFRLDVTDCTAFVLTNAALLYSQNLQDAWEMMKFLNYRSGTVTFENRLHFTTDRNEASPYFRDITAEAVCSCKLKTIKLTLNKIKPDGKRLIDIDWEKEAIIKYVPNRYITQEFLSSLTEVVGVAFVKEENFKKGLDVSHEGFLFDGELFFHASSVEKKVVAINFFDYYSGKDGSTPKFDGIILFDPVVEN